MSAITLTDLQNAALDVATISNVANSNLPTTTTRLGATISTLAGVLAAIGYLPPVAYTTGLVVNSTLYTVTSGGLQYAPLPNLVPFTTSGAFNPAQWFLLQVTPSTYIKTLLDDVDAATARGTLGAAASGANTDLTSVVLGNTGLAAKDTDASNKLTLKPNSNLTADRTLNLVTGDVDRTLDISAASVTISAFVATLLDDANAAAFWTTQGISAYVQTLLNDVDATTARATLGANKFVRFCDIGDETTNIATGTGKFSFRMPFAATLTAVRASLATASSAGLPTVNIKKNGTTVLSTNLSINASSKTSVGATTPAVISVSSVAADDEMTIDITVAGTGAKGLKVQLEYTF